jgi:hypothetical protein
MNLDPDHLARLLGVIRRCSPSQTDEAFAFAADLLRMVDAPSDHDIAEVCHRVLDVYGVKRR